MLVHNSIVGDARVRKEAGSLRENGYWVDLFGLSPSTGEAPSMVEGCKLILVDYRSCESLPILMYRFLVGSKGQIVLSALLLALVLLNGVFWLLTFEVFGYFLLGSLLGVSVFIYMDMRKLRDSVLGTVLITSWMRRSLFLKAYKLRARALASAVDGASYDVIHAHDIIALMAGVSLKKRFPDLRLVWDAHEIYTELNYRIPEGRQLVSRVICDAAKFVDAFITINQSISVFYKERFPSLPVARVVMNATRKEQMGTKTKLLRVAAGIDDEQLILLFQGGLSENRGIEQLLDACIDFPEDWSIVFMGSGPLEELIRERVVALNSTRVVGKKVVSLVPPAPYEELLKWTSGADLGAILYKNTNLNHFFCTPNKLWEYPNAGVPILASNLPEMGALIDLHKTGILVSDELSGSEISEIIRNTDRKVLAALSENCIKFSQTNTWEAQVDNLLELYRGFEQ